MESRLPCPYLFVAVLLLLNSFSPVDATDLKPKLRRPVSLSLSEDDRWLYTANRNSGDISVIDTSTRSVVREIQVGGRLSDVATLSDTRLLALDEEEHQLVLLSGRNDQWRVAGKLDVPKYPVRLCVDKQANQCFISSLWSRSVTKVDLSGAGRARNPQIQIAGRAQLSFEPREMCLARKANRLIVAGSFKNTLAVFDTSDLELVTTKDVSGHNIRGLAIGINGERLLLTQQELNPLARSTRDDVHWGNMVTNLLVSFRLDDVCNPQANVMKQRDVTYLGEPGNAAGDPGSIAVGPAGQIAVSLGGVNELAVGRENDQDSFKRMSVGNHPRDVVWTTGGIIYVADMFSDSVSIVDATCTQKVERVVLGPQPELSPADIGEMLFFDSRISHDGWMSCHSCHSDGHSSGQLNDNLSDGSYSAPKRVLSLLGVSQTGPWAWNGGSKSLEDQVKSSIENTMQGARPPTENVDSIVAYLKTLEAPPALPVVGVNQKIVTDQIDRGRELFRSLDCQNCHSPPFYTVADTFDIGLTDAVGNARFNPPSLRGVGRRSKFFHDASATSLREVLVDREHQLNRELSSTELDLLLLFLKTI